MHPENQKDQSPSVSASPWPSKSFETDDPDEVVGYLNGQNRSVVRAITPLDKTTKFVFTRKELDLGRVSLVHSTSSPIQIHTINSSVLTVVVSERGNSLFKVGRTEVASRNGDAAIAAATTSGDGIFQSLSEDSRFLLQLPRQHFLAESQAEKGSIVRSFPARIELSTPVAASFHRALNYVWQQQGSVNALLRAAYDEILLYGLVSLLTPSLCGGEATGRPGPGEHYVRRACELISARSGEPLRMADIAAELGIGPRHLQSGFRRHLGITPHQFLRDCRLDEANRRLGLARPGDTATAIAYDCGFGHLGEFAQSYRLRFGESPSETLRRSFGRA